MEALEDLTLVRAAMVYHEYHFENSNMGDMGDIFGDIFGNMFHGQKNSGYSRQSSGFGGQGFHSGFRRKRIWRSMPRKKAVTSGQK